MSKVMQKSLKSVSVFLLCYFQWEFPREQKLCKVLSVLPFGNDIQMNYPSCKYVKWWGVQINDTRILILFADAFIAQKH